MRPTTSNMLQLFIAAWTALCVAMLLDLHNPFWAAMPIWVVSQVYREDMLIRGFLRVLGTVIGAALGYAILAYITNDALRIILLALIVGISTGTAYWIGTIYSYGALITGITSAVIVIPAFTGGDQVMQYAVDRFWCTLIGVLSVTLVTFAFTPHRTTERPVPPKRGRFQHGVVRGAISGTITLASGLVLATTSSFAAMSAALALAIFSSLLGSMPDPRPVMRHMPVGVSLGVLGAITYRALLFWLHPGLPVHLLLAGVFILIGAFLRSQRRTAILAIDFNMCFLLAAEVGHEVHGLELVTIGGVAMGLSALAVAQTYRWLPIHVDKT